MTASKFTDNSFWLKIVVACVVLALVFNFFTIGVAMLFSTVLGLFVDLILFVVLDVFVATILLAVDILVFFVVDVFVAALLVGVDIFVYLLLAALSIAGYAAVCAAIIIPLALIYKYNRRQNLTDDASFK